MARQHQEKQDWEGAVDLILGGAAYLKINNYGSSPPLTPTPSPAPFPVYVSQLEFDLCLEINKLAPLSAWDFSFIRRHSPATAREEVFLSSSR